MKQLATDIAEILVGRLPQLNVTPEWLAGIIQPYLESRLGPLLTAADSELSLVAEGKAGRKDECQSVAMQLRFVCQGKA